MHTTFRRLALRVPAAILVLAALAALAACSAAGSSPSPTTGPTLRPTPTPIAAKVVTPEDAATLVIATDPIFAGTGKLDPEIIGASKWWTATPLPDGGYQIEITVGWGDCMAGCIERHTWTYTVTPDGFVEKVGETGDPVPVDLPA